MRGAAPGAPFGLRCRGGALLGREAATAPEEAVASGPRPFPCRPKGVPSLGPELQLPLLALSVVVVYAICHLLGRLLLRLLHLQSPLLGTAVPWALFQAYLVVGLFIWGGLPAPAGPFAAVAGITGLLTLVWALARRQRDTRTTLALLVAWAAIWVAALLWSTL